MEELAEAVRNSDPVDVLEQRLRSVHLTDLRGATFSFEVSDQSKPVVSTEREGGAGPLTLDLLQLAVVSRNAEAVHLLLSRTNAFSEPHSPPCNAYLHLACALGDSLIVNVLLERRHADFRVAPLCYPRACSGDAHVRVHPAEVAARGGHLKCLELLLTRYQMTLQRDEVRLYPRAPGVAGSRRRPRTARSRSDAELCVMLQSPAALALLLSAHRVTEEQLNLSFTLALNSKCGKSLDLLLSHGTPHYSSGTVNTFHCLYIYGSFTSAASLLKCTRVLLKHKQKLHEDEIIAGTYPLYSAIYSLVQNFQMDQTNDFSVQAELLTLLIDEGCSLYVDEDAIFRMQGVAAVGREVYSSAIKCFLVNDYLSGWLGKSQDSELSGSNSVRLQNYFDDMFHLCLGEGPANCCSWHRKVPFVDLFQVILRYAELQPPILTASTYVEKFLRAGGMLDAVNFVHFACAATNLPHFDDDLKRCFLMILASLTETQLKPYFSGLVDVIYYETVRNDDLLEFLFPPCRTVPSLVHLSRVAIWQATGRCERRISQLKCPPKLRSLILDLWSAFDWSLNGE